MLERANHIVETMPIKPNLAILGSLLGACRLHNNMELGEVVLRKIGTLGGRSGGIPVLLSNRYANENKWNEDIQIRKEVREEMQERPPGRSWMQMKHELYEFVAGDKVHPQSKELHTLVEEFAKMLIY